MSNANSNLDATRLLQALKDLVDASDPWIGMDSRALRFARKNARAVIKDASESHGHEATERAASGGEGGAGGTHFARIVPAVSARGPHPTRGTEVWIGDTRLSGVTEITLRADLNDVWRATIKCHVEPPAALLAAAVFEVRKPERWWQRALRWINGEPSNVTGLASSAMEWER